MKKPTRFRGSNLIMVTHLFFKMMLDGFRKPPVFFHQPFWMYQKTNLTAVLPPKIVAPSRHPNSIPSHQPSHLIGQDEGSVSQQWWPPNPPEKGSEISRQNWWLFRGKNGEQRQQNLDMTFAWNTEGSYSDPHNGCHSIPHVTSCWPLEIPYIQQITRGFGHCSAISLRFFAWRNLPHDSHDSLPDFHAFVFMRLPHWVREIPHMSSVNWLI